MLRWQISFTLKVPPPLPPTPPSEGGSERGVFLNDELLNSLWGGRRRRKRRRMLPFLLLPHSSCRICCCRHEKTIDHNQYPSLPPSPPIISTNKLPPPSFDTLWRRELRQDMASAHAQSVRKGPPATHPHIFTCDCVQKRRNGQQSLIDAAWTKSVIHSRSKYGVSLVG